MSGKTGKENNGEKLLPEDIIKMVKSYDQYNYMNTINMENDDETTNYESKHVEYKSQTEMLLDFYNGLYKKHVRKNKGKYEFVVYDHSDNGNEYYLEIDTQVFDSYELSTKILIIVYMLNISKMYSVRYDKHTIMCSSISQDEYSAIGSLIVCCSSEIFKFFDIKDLIAKYYRLYNGSDDKYYDIYNVIIPKKSDKRKKKRSISISKSNSSNNSETSFKSSLNSNSDSISDFDFDKWAKKSPVKTKSSPVKSKKSPVKTKSSPVKSKKSPVKSKKSPIKSKKSPVKTDELIIKNKKSTIEDEKSQKGKKSDTKNKDTKNKDVEKKDAKNKDVEKKSELKKSKKSEKPAIKNKSPTKSSVDGSLCQCKTKTGKECKRKPEENSIYCFQHQTCEDKNIKT